MKLTKKQITEVKRDVAVFLSALFATDALFNDPTKAAVAAAVIAAVKVTVRSVFPHEDAGA